LQSTGAIKNGRINNNSLLNMVAGIQINAQPSDKLTTMGNTVYSSSPAIQIGNVSNWISYGNRQLNSGSSVYNNAPSATHTMVSSDMFAFVDVSTLISNFAGGGLTADCGTGWVAIAGGYDVSPITMAVNSSCPSPDGLSCAGSLSTPTSRYWRVEYNFNVSTNVTFTLHATCARNDI
jgi:hypothetical protein